MDQHKSIETVIQMVYVLVLLEIPGSDGTSCYTRADACSSSLVVKSGDLTRSKKTSGRRFTAVGLKIETVT